MTAFECYKEYIALKNHFSVDHFDYLKYNGKLKISYNTFEKRSDRIFFEKLSQKTYAKYLLIAHLSDNPGEWIGNISSNTQKYYEWKKVISGFSYIFSEDIKKLKKEHFILSDGYPEVFNMLLRKELHKETFIVLNECMKFVPLWNKTLHDDIVWNEYIFRLKKYSQFLDLDINNYCKVLKTHFANIQ